MSNFIEEIIENDNATGKYQSRVVTRFPPEPNGYLHIGHSKSICLNFGLGLKYNGYTNLRFDDTNPSTEEDEYVRAIRKDIEWLGFKWNDEILFASDYFSTMYEKACLLIRKNKAYVDFSTPEQIAEMKGTPIRVGVDSPYRNTSPEENLALFEKMKNGDFEDGECILRAKIDMASPNMLLRDPILYRIKKEKHHRTGTTWNIYPMYDYAHPISDSIEKITHSICTLEFEVHRPLYDWVLVETEMYRSQQIEFARLNLNYTLMSKRVLLKLVNGNYVSGWDDPRMPTISALRRRGFTPASIRNFAERVGVARRDNVIEYSLLEFFLREDLNKIAKRVMAVLDPLKVVITNYPEDKTEYLSIENNPENTDDGSRELPFSRELYIEQEDFMEIPPKKYFRLFPNGVVRLKGAYIIRCDQVIKDENGKIIELHCSYYPDSRSGHDTSGIEVKGVIHWVSVPHAITAEVRLYDRLFKDEFPAEKIAEYPDFAEAMKHVLNENSLQIVHKAYLEPNLANVSLDERFQFIRKGYFCLDTDSTPQHLIFNRTVTLKDSWAKMNK
jgi:glutaminyl-tRNA synthetase